MCKDMVGVETDLKGFGSCLVVVGVETCMVHVVAGQLVKRQA
jgi:hypothetical protein